jgi:hypothetical protein
MLSSNMTFAPAAEGPSYRACPLCGFPSYDHEACGHCFAPAEVVRSIQLREKPPRFVGVLGASGVGKTVYLGMLLDMLARGSAGLRGMPFGSFSLGLHRNVILALERQRFPAKTPAEPDHWHWVHCEVRSTTRRGTVLDIVTPDVAGEAVAAELALPNSHPTIRTLIGRCAGLVTLVDTLQVVSDGQSQELFAMQLVSYLASYRPARRRAKVGVPMALVLTKADLCPDALRDPEGFARANAPGLWRLCEARLETFRFFAAGVAGAIGTLVGRDGEESLVPLRIEPRGIVEPFAWLVNGG